MAVKIYTRTGDEGITGLFGGKRVPKDSLKIEAYGTVDELNAIVGLARVFNEERLNAGVAHGFLDELLRRIQDELFNLGSELATAPGFTYEGMCRIGQTEVQRIEETIDHCQLDLPPLKTFILPGGGKVGGFLHQARTVCRRAERAVLRLSREEQIGEWPLIYLNRLSDLFFVLARWAGEKMGEKEYVWHGGLKKTGEEKLGS